MPRLLLLRRLPRCSASSLTSIPSIPLFSSTSSTPCLSSLQASFSSASSTSTALPPRSVAPSGMKIAAATSRWGSELSRSVNAINFFQPSIGMSMCKFLSVSASAAAENSMEGTSADEKPKPRARRPRKAVLTLTERAKERLAELMASKSPSPAGVRLGVRTRGCNGLSYTMNYVDEPPKLDDVVEAGDNIKVYVDPKAVMYLLGSVMDFVEDTVRAEFVFQNPNAKGSCGCGESFNV
ncbi:hypothetical protein GUITHDRAFT_154876 [Guillardia theta CCMP2712]|uniref:Core domain-containing protein n=2 Tax=Guillardia theta TaxID=55529 RepID=L1IND2_GUITC|nr:hypothetical protein GUITHDRAFT_154876 [Guillardia theta CCMP2712]EKX37763.1 hypothetical protein GUITHDRAFT_154876 [Guillardia theta CCMP2712]CAH25346.1 Fe-S assembly protein 1 [Guillardia theta]|eukprot:XP_005824743.1 hypothetical protein GUITHDRAFT_154876 [Guillardia theta CCMP2712]